MSGFVKGLQIEIKTEELREHLHQRVAYHSAKADNYAMAQKGVAVATEDEEENLSNSPKESLRRSEKKHRNTATYFNFIADHLFPDTTYNLDQNDLVTIEIMDRGW